MKETKERNKAITLVGLVVTIIILLILAGISISTLRRRKWNIKKNARGGRRT